MTFVKDAECLGPYFLALTELCTGTWYKLTFIYNDSAIMYGGMCDKNILRSGSLETHFAP